MKEDNNYIQNTENKRLSYMNPTKHQLWTK